MIRIMSADATQVIYLSESQQKKYKEMKRHGLRDASGETDDPKVWAAALGIPMFD